MRIIYLFIELGRKLYLKWQWNAYAEDTQLYLHCRRDDTTATVSHWMAANRLKLNAEKTELLWAESRYML